MAGLSNFIQNKALQETTMPSWYDQAQQNIVSQAGTAAGAMPSLQNTVAGGAISNLSGPQNPFFQAQNTLNQISSGAANPWLVSDTGQVTPNTATALGGLFQAQNQQLNQLLPNITAPVTGGAVGTGQFGSLRGMTARDKAVADAQAALFAQQMDAALRNQQTGVSAATGLGNVGQQGTQTMTTLGQAQQSDPFTAAANYGKIVGGITAPTKVMNVTELSPLNQIMGIANVAGGVLGELGIKGGLGGLIKEIPGWFKGLGESDFSWLPASGTNVPASDYPDWSNTQSYD